MLFRTVLWSIGVLLAITSRIHARCQGQITRDMTVTIAAHDGAARTYVFCNRRVNSHAGAIADATLQLTFRSSAEGARILLAPDAVLRIVRGLCAREVELVGMPAHVLWFYEMVIHYLPWRRPRYRAAPNAYIAHNPNGLVADRITREPAVEGLDLDWTDAVRQREKICLWQVGKGAPSPGRVPGFNYLADIPANAVEKS